MFDQESIASLCGIAEFGLALSHDRIVAALAEVVSDPQAEIIEYVRRDVLNVALGNRDNHLRNTALQRFVDGTIRLTPLSEARHRQAVRVSRKACSRALKRPIVCVPAKTPCRDDHR
jgi:hypothetical protein